MHSTSQKNGSGLSPTQAADRAIAAYDAVLFPSVGRPSAGARLDTLAAAAALECEAAAKARGEPKWVREHYRSQAEFFRSQVLGA